LRNSALMDASSRRGPLGRFAGERGIWLVRLSEKTDRSLAPPICGWKFGFFRSHSNASSSSVATGSGVDVGADVCPSSTSTTAAFGSAMVGSVISSEKVSAKPERDDVGTSSIVITGAVGQCAVGTTRSLTAPARADPPRRVDRRCATNRRRRCALGGADGSQR